MTSTTHLFEAMMARIQYRGSEELALVIPYRGIWQHTRYTNRATTVHRQRSRKGTWMFHFQPTGPTFFSGFFTSGMNPQRGSQI